MGRLKFATVCSSNMNRSMEAHSFLAKKGFTVESFGSGQHVKLPGVTLDRPNIYEFGTSYADIIDDLKRKDKNFYTQNGLLHMLERNRRIKIAPQRFQDAPQIYDVVVCLEERVYDQVVEELSSRQQSTGASVHVINIDIADNHEEATIGAFLVCELCALLRMSQLESCDDLDNEIDEVLNDFENKCARTILHTLLFL